MIFYCSVSGLISHIVFSFRGLAISAARFLVVVHHFRICKRCHSSTYHCDLHLPPMTNLKSHMNIDHSSNISKRKFVTVISFFYFNENFFTLQ